MDITQGLVGCCLTVVNAVAFIVYGIDKCRARNGKWRIPEATLLMTGYSVWVFLFFFAMHTVCPCVFCIIHQEFAIRTSMALEGSGHTVIK